MSRFRRVSRELGRLIIHATGAVLGLLLVLYAAPAWAVRGFPVSIGYSLVPDDDGSFWMLVIGLFLLAYCGVVVATSATDARDAAHNDEETPPI